MYDRWTRQFRDPELEAAYRSHDLRRNIADDLPTLSLALTGTFVLFGAVDLLVVPDVLTLAWTLRFGIVVPLFMVMTTLAWKRKAQHLYPLFSWVGGWAGPALFFAVGTAALRRSGGFLGGPLDDAMPALGGLLYLAYPIVFTVLFPGVARLGVRDSFLFGFAVTAAYMLIDFTLLSDLRPWPAAIFIGILHGTGWVYAVMAAQVAESAGRKLYLARREATDLLHKTLPEPVAEELRRNRSEGDPDALIAHDLQGVTVLFADLVGFTRYAADRRKRDASDIVRRLNDLVRELDEACRAYELEKIKTIGDAYMLAGGLFPERSSAEARVAALAEGVGCDPDTARAAHHAAAAADMALDMQRILAAHNGRNRERDGDFDFAYRIGLHVGPLTAGVVGDDKFVYDLWGDTVNVASRMESHGTPGCVQVSGELHDLLERCFPGRFLFEPQPELRIKSIEQPLRAYLLSGRAAAP